MNKPLKHGQVVLDIYYTDKYTLEHHANQAAIRAWEMDGVERAEVATTKLIPAPAEPAPEPRKTVNWTPAMLERLRQRHRQAVLAKELKFDFDGITLLTDYAKYLIEYLDTRFNAHTRGN